MANIPILLLAAGGSTRMGSPKQLILWGNQTLIEYQTETLKKTGNPVSVVLGGNANHIISVIEKYNVPVFRNYYWEDGMGSSITTGIKGVTREFPLADGVLIALVDQPLIPLEHFQKMLEAFQTGKQQIIISQSASGWKGVPALFDNWYFEELGKLRGEAGAKTIIQKYENNVISLDCGDVLVDMDTPESYRQILERFVKNP
jgi:molybdenum cofactor cytidylyltransferase